ncbi:MAG TPA: DUF2231 domain-containing protein [Bryobacteraceae bacterium]|nr:DUF2231 domain-containing protein [Bryobacteraceae bacterium]
MLPLTLLAISLLFDVAYLSTGRHQLALFAYWIILAGVICGIAAAVWDVFESWALPACRRSKNVDLWHGLVNAAVTLLFIASWVLRRPHPAAPPNAAIVLSLAGVATMVAMSWLGGELVDHLSSRDSRRHGSDLQPRARRA